MHDTVRIWRSWKSAFGDQVWHFDPWKEETVTALDVYTDEELARIKESGFNAIWIHGNLNNMVRTEVFPELGKDSALHQKRMNELVERAARHGIKVFVYCQPGRALLKEDEFWLKHPDVAGQVRGGEPFQFQSLCTSTEKVKKYLYQAGAELAKKIPELGGVIIITASEYQAHCYSHNPKDCACPRCNKRTPVEVVNEVIRLVRDGIRSASSEWKIIAWNWSWSFYVPAPCSEIINALPDDVILLVDFERGGHKVIAGKNRWIDEYSLSFGGPSEQFIKSFEAAKKRGIGFMAKLQFGTTHELATVPNLPLLGNVFTKADFVRKNKLPGFMGCWNFGNMVTANTAAFNAFLSGRLPDNRDEALKAFCAGYFPGCDALLASKAFLKFGDAMDNYPFCIPYLYYGPTNFSFVLPTEPGSLSGKLVGRSWMIDERGDELGEQVLGKEGEDEKSEFYSDYSPDVLADCFAKITSVWHDGLLELRKALASCSHRHAVEELNTAAVCYHSFRSTRNFLKIYCLRRKWDKGMLPEYRNIIRDELENLKEVLLFVESDDRFGYHIEAHGYQYDAERISKRIAELESQTNSQSER